MNLLLRVLVHSPKVIGILWLTIRETVILYIAITRTSTYLAITSTHLAITSTHLAITSTHLAITSTHLAITSYHLAIPSIPLAITHLPTWQLHPPTWKLHLFHQAMTSTHLEITLPHGNSFYSSGSYPPGNDNYLTWKLRAVRKCSAASLLALRLMQEIPRL